jgi:hypothetical protein
VTNKSLHHLFHLMHQSYRGNLSLSYMALKGYMSLFAMKRYNQNIVSNNLLQLLVDITHLVVSIQLSHRLFLVCNDPYEISLAFAHLPSLMCKHMYKPTHT